MATQQQPRSTLVSVAVLSGASTLCLARVFSGWGWLLPVVIAATASVALGAACDRWGRRTPLTFLALLLGGALMGIEAAEPGATMAGIPTPTAISDFGHDLSQMVHTLHSAAVPGPADRPALLLSVLAAWATGSVAYACATRLSGSLAPLVAPLTVFVTVSALGRGSHGPTTAAFGAGVAVFLLAQHRSTLTDRRARFHAGASRVAAPIAGAAAATVIAIAAALIAGPTLPGARSSPLLDYRRLGGTGTGPNHLVVITPLVDIRDRLKESPGRELFTVDADHPTYWRIAGLDEFDGDVWGIAETESLPLSALSSNARSTGTVVNNEARFNVTTLAGPWIPVSYRPTSVDLPGARPPGSDTVIRDGDINTTYTVRSADPSPTQIEMGFARVETGGSAAADLDLPRNFPDQVRTLAHNITDDAGSPYAKALALQNYLRNGYEYSLSVPKGHSDQALVDFLFKTKAGFCEQFSSAFAAMARSIGLPTRVAVGFTTGTPDPVGRVPRHDRQRARVARGRLRGHRMGPLRADARSLRTIGERRDRHREGRAGQHDTDDQVGVAHHRVDDARPDEELDEAAARARKPGNASQSKAAIDRGARAPRRARRAGFDRRRVPVVRRRGRRAQGAPPVAPAARADEPRSRDRCVGRSTRATGRGADTPATRVDAGRVRDARRSRRWRGRRGTAAARARPSRDHRALRPRRTDTRRGGRRVDHGVGAREGAARARRAARATAKATRSAGAALPAAGRRRSRRRARTTTTR